MAQMYWIIPVEGGGRPDNTLPGGQGETSQPIYHPGHPDHGLPPFPDQGLPGGSGGSQATRFTSPVFRIRGFLPEKISRPMNCRLFRSPRNMRRI